MELSYTSLFNMVATKNMWLLNILIVAGETVELNFEFYYFFKEENHGKRICYLVSRLIL